MRKIVATAAVAASVAALGLLTPTSASAVRSAPSSGLSICATGAGTAAVISGPPAFGQTSIWIAQNSCQTFPGASGTFRISIQPDPDIANPNGNGGISDSSGCTGPNPGQANWSFCRLPFAYTEVVTGGNFGSTAQYASPSVDVVVAKNCGILVDFVHAGNN